MTSTRSPQYGSYAAGTRTPSSLAAVAAATAVMFRASMRRSSSSRSASAKPWARSTAPTERPQRVPRCSRPASRWTMSRSGPTSPAAAGLRTLTTTRSPDGSVATCTWAIEAAAIGASAKLANFSLTGPPSEPSSTALMSGHATLGASSCSRLSSAMNSCGSRSRRVESTWPSLTNVTPPSSRASRSERASRARPSVVASSARRPPRRYGSRPWRARIRLICE